MSDQTVPAPDIDEQDILVRTGGLDEEELAAVISVVRAAIQEEIEANGFGEGGADRAAQRWRRSIDVGRGTGIGWGLDGLCGDREWR